VADQPR
jgi:hypothetical protein